MSFSILLLTEDSGKHSFKTIEAITRATLEHLDPTYQPQSLHFEPANEDVRLAMRANFWKAQDSFSATLLVRSIATKLSQEDAVVIFHFDGDRPWKKRATCENQDKFKRKILKPLRDQLSQPPPPGPKKRTLSPTTQAPKLTEEEIERRLARLVCMVPYWCIESWLYQNTREALRICTEEYGGRDADLFKEWEEKRSLLDEFKQPKEATCLKDHHNYKLASTHFPIAELIAVGKSFAEWINTMKPLSAGLSAECREFISFWELREFEKNLLPPIPDLDTVKRWLARVSNDDYKTPEEILAPPKEDET